MKRWIGFSKHDTPEYYIKYWNNILNNSKFNIGRIQALISKVKNGDKVIDIGAGVKGAAEYIASLTHIDADLYALDFSPTAKEIVDKYNLPLKYITNNVLSTGQNDSDFDVVIAGEVIEHLERPEDLVKEMARICKNNGWMCISTVDPYCVDSFINRCVYPEHVLEFTPEDLIELFKPYGEPEYKRVGNYDCIFCQRKIYVVDLDDFSEKNNKLDLLFEIKSKNHNFKCTLFTVPGETSTDWLNKMSAYKSWLQFAVHGLNHNANECLSWDELDIINCLDYVEKTKAYKKIFKPPYWQDNAAIKKELLKRGYTYCQNKDTGYTGKQYIINKQSNIISIHGHVQNVCGNGLEEIKNTLINAVGEFKFISEI